MEHHAIPQRADRYGFVFAKPDMRVAVARVLLVVTALFVELWREPRIVTVKRAHNDRVFRRIRPT
jgi:hypothetical protein